MAIEKIDEKLIAANAKFRELAQKINTTVAIVIILSNGFLVALATTGYLAEDTVSLYSLAGSLYIWQFLITVFSLTCLIYPTTSLFMKFFISGVLGYSMQWQVFASVWPTESFQPIVDNGFASFLFVLGCLGGLKYCFTGNDEENKKHRDNILHLDSRAA